MNSNKDISLRLYALEKSVEELSLRQIAVQKFGKRLSVLENSFEEIKGQVLLHGFDSRRTKHSCQHERIQHPWHLNKYNPTTPQKGKGSALPPSRILKHICDELYDSISLPGVRFVGQGKNWMHRYLWVILHMITFSISFNYIKDAYDNWQDSPVVMSLNNSLTRVADIPFPAVTICSFPSVSNDYNIPQHVSKCSCCTNDSADSFCQLSDKWSNTNEFPLVCAAVLCGNKHDISANQWKLIDDMFNNHLPGVDQFSSETKKIGLHHPGEVPMEENTRFYNFRAERDISINVKPTLITSQKNLAQYEPSQRGCFFSHERKLTLFKYYTQQNCQMECKVNCSMVACGCVPIYLPRLNSSVNICNTSNEYSCVDYTIQDIQRNMLSMTYPACYCNCLPDCTSLDYEFIVDDINIDPSKMGHNNTFITIKYQDKEFSSKIRHELRNLADFVADSGGFLGVFNGFSFMVVFELFYFLTVRLWSSIKKNWRLAVEEDSADDKIQENYEHSFNQSEII